MIEQLQFLSPEQVRAIGEQWGTPVLVFNEDILRRQARRALAFAAPYGLTAYYAMKANPHGGLLAIFREEGLNIDASSGPEIERALRAGFRPEQILVTAQQLPDNIRELAERGVQFNASSLQQLEQIGHAIPGAAIGVRINPGMGSGHSQLVNVGGVTSSFGIWQDYIGAVGKLAHKYDLTIKRLHTHIGSGTDPAEWHRAVNLSLSIIEDFPEATILNLGGGFKVARTAHEKHTDLEVVSKEVTNSLQTFAERTGRKLHLEVEPGTFLVAQAGAIISKVQDITDTGADGFNFLKIDAGLSDIIRPAMYGSQHPIIVVNNRRTTQAYVVVGRACESADMLTPVDHQPGKLEPRLLRTARIGDPVVIEATGGYVYTQNNAGYNSYGQAAIVLIASNGQPRLIYRRQTLDDLLANEVL
jgi:diaminopimelate decarboxylase